MISKDINQDNTSRFIFTTTDKKVRINIEIEAENVEVLENLLNRFFKIPRNDHNFSLKPLEASTIVEEPEVDQESSLGETLLSADSGLFAELAQMNQENEEECVEEKETEFKDLIETKHPKVSTTKSNKLQQFLESLTASSRKVVDVLMQKGKPVLNDELVLLTGLKDARGLGGAMRGINNAARKVGLRSCPVHKVVSGNGQISFEFYYIE